VCVGTVSVEVENAACPLPLRTVGPERTIPGAAQFAPSINVTLPVVTAVTPTFTEAVKVTLFPKSDGFADEAIVVIVFEFELKVTVIICEELFIVNIQVKLPNVHPEFIVYAGTVQAPTNDPEAGVAVKVTTSKLFNPFWLQFGVFEATPATLVQSRVVPLIVEVPVTLPLPVPVKVIVTLLLSVKAVWAVKSLVPPTAANR
jgi:hypothetical protein